MNQILTNKSYQLIAGSLVLLLISYQLAFKETVNSWQINRQLKEQVEGMDNLANQPGLTERKYNNLGKILDQFRVDTTNFRARLITSLSLLAEKSDVRLIEIPTSTQDTLHKYMQVHRVTVKGRYYDLVRFLNYAETATKNGHVRALLLFNDSHQEDFSAGINLQLSFIGIN